MCSFFPQGSNKLYWSLKSWLTTSIPFFNTSLFLQCYSICWKPLPCYHVKFPCRLKNIILSYTHTLRLTELASYPNQFQMRECWFCINPNCHTVTFPRRNRHLILVCSCLEAQWKSLQYQLLYSHVDFGERVVNYHGLASCSGGVRICAICSAVTIQAHDKTSPIYPIAKKQCFSNFLNTRHSSENANS